MQLKLYLRCERDHPTAVSLGERMTAAGRPCTKCGKPLIAEPERERGPPRRY